MYWDVVDVYPVASRELGVRFEDGLSGILRIDQSFCTGVFKPLLDDTVVSEALIDNGVLVWPNGLDLAPDTLYWEIKNNPLRRYELRRKTKISDDGKVQIPRHPHPDIAGKMQFTGEVEESSPESDWDLK